MILYIYIYIYIYVMDSLVNLDIWEPNSSDKVVNCWITSENDLFIVMKACIKPTPLFRWTDDRRMMYYCATDSPEQQFSDSE